MILNKEADPAALSFDRSWPQIHHHLRNVYIDRVKYILLSSLGSYTYLDEEEAAHPSFFKRVYTSYYEKMDAEVIRKEVLMPGLSPAWFSAGVDKDRANCVVQRLRSRSCSLITWIMPKCPRR